MKCKIYNQCKYKTCPNVAFFSNLAPIANNLDAIYTDAAKNESLESIRDAFVLQRYGAALYQQEHFRQQV